MSTQNKIREALAALDQLRGIDPFISDPPMRQLFARHFYAGVNALSELEAQPSAPTVDQITLEGEQSDPCGTITVKVRMSDGCEVEAIRTNANSIYHMVTLADPAFGK